MKEVNKKTHDALANVECKTGADRELRIVLNPVTVLGGPDPGNIIIAQGLSRN